MGDLHEEYIQRATDRGAVSAQSWYRRQVIRSLLPLLRSRARTSANLKAVTAAAMGSLTVVLALAVTVPAAIVTLTMLHVPIVVRPMVYLAVMCAAVGAGGYVAAAMTRVGSRGPVLLTSGFSCALLVLLFVASPDPEQLGVWLLWLPEVLGT